MEDLQEKQNKITSKLIHQEDHIIGVKYNYKEAIEIGIKRTLLLADDTHLPPSGSTLKVKIKDGVDGSGPHAIYHQLNNVNTHNMILYMFCILDIIDVQTKSPIFTEQHPNSPNAMRPLFILMGKETLPNLDDVKIAFNQRGLNLEFVLEVRSRIYNIEIDAFMTMIDGKMRCLLSGLGGAYCVLCLITLKTACGRDGDYTSFLTITRSAEKNRALWDKLVDEDNCIKKRKNDYEIRGGLMQEPLVGEDLTMLSPLHCLMRSFSFVLKLISFEF